MSSKNEPIGEKIRLLAILGSPFVFAVGMGLVLDDHLSPLMIWGGSKCETVQGVQGCFGYPPTGFTLLVLTGAFLVGGVGYLLGNRDE